MFLRYKNNHHHARTRATHITLAQGCFIGCPSCDHVSGRRQTDLCGLGMKSTVNDPALRSLNRAAIAGSPQDIYRHNPWRSPGSAPVAGGNPLPHSYSTSLPSDRLESAFGLCASFCLVVFRVYCERVWARDCISHATMQMLNPHKLNSAL